MKSKRAEEAIERYRKKFTAGFVTKNEVETVKEYCRLFTEVVELAEQDAEERHKEAIEEVKERAVRAHIESCYSVVPSDCDVKLCTECKRTNYFLQKLNEQ